MLPANLGAVLMGQAALPKAMAVPIGQGIEAVFQHWRYLICACNIHDHRVPRHPAKYQQLEAFRVKRYWPLMALSRIKK
jgi:hypothetical protein